MERAESVCRFPSKPGKSRARRLAAAFLAGALGLVGLSSTASAQSCPYDYPVDCGDGWCCGADFPYCCGGGLCAADPSGCGPSGDPGGTCPTGYPVDCGDGTCCQSEFPVCCGNGMCASDPSACDVGSGPSPGPSPGPGPTTPTGDAICDEMSDADCTMRFCATVDQSQCWYEVDGQFIGCSSCWDLTNCQQAAADAYDDCTSGCSYSGSSPGWLGLVLAAAGVGAWSCRRARRRSP